MTYRIEKHIKELQTAINNMYESKNETERRKSADKVASLIWLLHSELSMKIYEKDKALTETEE